MIEKELVFVFLVVLNNEFDEVWGRILGHEVLSSTQEVFFEVSREESRRNFMLGRETLEMESSILVAKRNLFSNALSGGNDNQNKKGNRLWCDHCRKLVTLMRLATGCMESLLI